MKRRYTDTDRELMRNIGENLKHTLKIKGVSQKELAELTGLSTSAVSDYVNGKALMNPGTVQLVADALKVTKGDIDPTYRGTISNEKSPVSNEKELLDLPIEELIKHNLSWKGHQLTEEQKQQFAKLVQAAADLLK